MTPHAASDDRIAHCHRANPASFAITDPSPTRYKSNKREIFRVKSPKSSGSQDSRPRAGLTDMCPIRGMHDPTDGAFLIVLHNTHRVVVTNWKILLQIALDVMLHPKPLAQVNHPQGVIPPIRQPGNFFHVIRLADLE
jgi:hypothetical protein